MHVEGSAYLVVSTLGLLAIAIGGGLVYDERRCRRLLKEEAPPDPEIEMIVQELDEWLARESGLEGEGGQVADNGDTLGLLRQFALRCQKVSVVGSCRRGKQNPGDLDILYIPKSNLQVIEFLEQIADDEQTITRKNTVWTCTVKGQRVDFIESTSAHWGWDLLTFTGSREFNERALRHAARRGLRTLRDGRVGIERSGHYGYTEIPSFDNWSEEKILTHLGLEAFLNPRTRDVPKEVEVSEVLDSVKQIRRVK